jgi:lipoprotein signal peptidase
MNPAWFLYGDLACSAIMLVAGCWLLTDRTLRRVNRVSHAFIAAGALANVLGIVADRVGFQDISYGKVWPGEVVVNIGLAVMMATWCWRSVSGARHRRRTGASAPA